MAPLTLLVGENSTGKTSFLAILRALWEVAVHEVVPDFRREPYDLGAFSEIVYNDSSRGDQPDSFQAGFRDSCSKDSIGAVSFHFAFQEVDGVTFPVSRNLSVGDTSFEVVTRPDGIRELRLDIEGRSWEMNAAPGPPASSREQLVSIELAMFFLIEVEDLIRDVPEHDEEHLPDKYVSRSIMKLEHGLRTWWHDRGRTFSGIDKTPFAGAPGRSKPRRTYDPSRPIPDPEGEYAPTYLANMSRRDSGKWKKLKKSLERFGSDSGLFDEISIESFGRTDDATPFQIQIRKFGKELKGNRRNLIDVGYGVSQTLPIITELLRTDAPPMFLLQQPEVHLHPSAQAALGSLFCSIAGSDRQLVVETHSDYIIDRVRMDVRDGTTNLKPEDVSILYFERGESDVKIHSIRIDADGNVLDAPEGYRQFFSDELTRSIGL